MRSITDSMEFSKMAVVAARIEVDMKLKFAENFG